MGGAGVRYAGRIGTPNIAALAGELVARFPGQQQRARAIVNGAIGDRLADADSALALPMTLSPDAAPARDVCLFVHGLMGCPLDWQPSAADATRVDLPEALAVARGVGIVHAHYNSGRHISSNGRALAEALNAFAEASPALASLSVVAHSMGGLVVRSACHYGVAAGQRWPSLLQRVFLLGVPVHGAPLEQLVHVAAFTLNTIWNPWTKLIGKAINLRSAGIKDLRHGFVLDEDWRNRDVDQLRLAAPRQPDVPGQTRWHVIAASLGDDGGWLSRVFGDGMVRRASARGHGFGSPRQGLVAGAELAHIPRCSHQGLLSSPDVLAQMLAWWPEL